MNTNRKEQRPQLNIRFKFCQTLYYFYFVQKKESLLIKEGLLYSCYMFGNEIVSEATICISLKKKGTAFRSIGPNNIYIFLLLFYQPCFFSFVFKRYFARPPIFLRNYSRYGILNLASYNNCSASSALTTSFPGSLFFPSLGATGDGKKRDPGNEVGPLKPCGIATYVNKEMFALFCPFMKRII